MNNNFGFRAAVDNATLWTLKQKVLHNEKDSDWITGWKTVCFK